MYNIYPLPSFALWHLALWQTKKDGKKLKKINQLN
jgi:hypothetical protein